MNLNTHPRLALDGTWQFHFDPTGGITPDQIQSWREATVPMPWQAQFDDLRQSSGTAWYRRTFTISTPVSAQEQAAILHFGAVDYHASVWVNGQSVGEHEGGYLPFEFDIAAQLKAGENEISVRVIDPTDDRSRYPAYPFGEIPHGKQSWYGPISGIWQSVWLELRPALHIQQVQVFPDAENASIAIHVQLSSALPSTASLQAKICDPAGKEIASTTLDSEGRGQISLPSHPARWSPDTPNLYTVEVTLASATPHTVSCTTGFRTVEGRDGRIYLNGQPIYLRAVLDQAYYPETIYTPPSLEYLEDQARKAKALGLNCLRTHIKIEDPRYYDVADRFGLLIWTEIPNWVLLTEETSQRAKETFRQMVVRDGHHPSIITWTLINENWGTDLVRNPEHRQWLRDFYYEAKAIDPTRLICDNSACCDNLHVAGDLDDFHDYKAIPDHAANWDAWVADFAGRPQWAWAADYNHERRADLPLIVSEFGNWGLPNPDTLKEKGQDPWWFETGHEWGEGIVYPHNMSERFNYLRLGDVFGSFEAFTSAAQEHMARSLHYEISTMRLHKPVAGYVITEFTDVHWECNGLLTMQREVKEGLDAIFTPINQDRVVIVRPLRWSGKPGEQVAVRLETSDVDGSGNGGLIQWRAGQEKGEIAAPGGVIDVTLAKAGMVVVEALWLDQTGNVIATNQVELACVDVPVAQGKVHVYENPALAAALAQLGYANENGTLEEMTSKGTVIVATRYTPALQTAVQQGAKLLIIAAPGFGKEDGNVRLPFCGVTNRAGTAWQGDWATAFSWIKKQGPFADLPGAPLCEMEYAEIMPDAVLTGLPAWAMREHSWAGLALGWIHKPVSLLAAEPYGKGKIAITTFKLNETTLPSHVVAQALFAGMVALLGQGIA